MREKEIKSEAPEISNDTGIERTSRRAAGFYIASIRSAAGGAGCRDREQSRLTDSVCGLSVEVQPRNSTVTDQLVDAAANSSS